jgi:hypothetical protein
MARGSGEFAKNKFFKANYNFNFQLLLKINLLLSK